MSKDKQNKCRGIGRILYAEWIIPLVHYYQIMRLPELFFDCIIPLAIAVGATIMYCILGDTLKALLALSDILPTAVSILIGFTVMLVTLLLTSSGDGISMLKEKHLKNHKNNDIQILQKPVTLYQGLHIQFIHSLFSEIFLLLIVFLFLFLYGLGWVKRFQPCFLGVEVYLTLTILFSIIRGIANIYFAFFK